MNILFVNDLPSNPIAGGIERVTDILAKELKGRGYNVYYLFGKLLPMQQYLLDYEYPAHLYQFENPGMFDNKDNIIFYENLQSCLAIDIVINQKGLGGRYNNMLPYTHTKVISVIHSLPDADILLWLNKIVELTVPPYAGLKKLLKKTCPFLISFYWRKKALENTRRKYNELAVCSDAIVTLSNSYIGMMKKFIDVSYKSRILSIPNPNTFNAVNVSLNKKENIVLYVGRLTKSEKEPLRLLKIWKCLHKKHPNWKLVIVGEGEEEPIMHDFVIKNKLNNVCFEGRQMNVEKYYEKASFVCLTSNFEGWGMALTEGMQFGCIPFTFDNYGAAFDIIDNNLNGCLIPAFNINKYASCLSQLMLDDKKRDTMSRAAIDKVKVFSVSNVSDQWECLFHSI